jgi:hypothetical protein
MHAITNRILYADARKRAFVCAACPAPATPAAPFCATCLGKWPMLRFMLPAPQLEAARS